jgi:hypothetical protein
MTTAIAAPAAVSAPAAPSTPAPTTPSNGADPKVGQPSDAPKPASAKSNTEPGAKPGETAAQTRQRLKVKLRKLDGPGEEELELGEDEVGRYVQKARMADKTRGEFDKRVQDFEAREKAAIENPLQFFKERGVDLLEVAAQEHARQQELAKLDPVQRELAEARDQLAKYETEKTAAAEKAKADAEAHAQRQLVLAEQTLYKQAIAASGRGAKTPAEAGYLMKLYADVREMAEHAGVPLTAEQLATAGDKLELSRFESMTRRCATSPEWRARNMKALQGLAEAITTGMDDGALMDFFGPKTASRLARAQLAAYRKSPIPMVADPRPDAQQPTTPRAPPAGDNESLMGMMDRISNR